MQGAQRRRYSAREILCCCNLGRIENVVTVGVETTVEGLTAAEADSVADRDIANGDQGIETIAAIGSIGSNGRNAHANGWAWPAGRRMCVAVCMFHAVPFLAVSKLYQLDPNLFFHVFLCVSWLLMVSSVVFDYYQILKIAVQRESFG